MSQPIVKKIKTAHKYYGQLVIGPPGAGKTTYCWKMSELLRKIGRKVIVINLDPANDGMAYEADIDIRKLINLEDVMAQYDLGPNGGLLYCMEHLEVNIDWLFKQISDSNGTNVIFDMPGQVELYSHHNSLNKIFTSLVESGSMQLCVIHLVDSHHCSDPGKFISALTLSLSAMLRIGLPHINVLTKIDILQKHEEQLQFGIDFYTEVLDLSYLLDSLDTDKFTSKYKKLNSALVSIIEDYGLVSFQLLNVFSDESLNKIKNSIDKANGYIFKTQEEGRSINSMLACAMGMQSKATHDLQDYLGNIDGKTCPSGFQMDKKQELACLQEMERDLDEKIKEAEQSHWRQRHMQLLHQYNDIKDATQLVVGHIASMQVTTVAEVHRGLGLEFK